VVSRGKVSVIPLPEDFPGEVPEGAAVLATKLLPVLKKRFPNDALPRMVYTDRGKGFFATAGPITPEWSAGLHAAGLRAFQGQGWGPPFGTVVANPNPGGHSFGLHTVNSSADTPFGLSQAQLFNGRARPQRVVPRQNAAGQPGKLGDTLIHETVVGWLRAGLTRTLPRRPHEETRADYFKRLTQVCAYANQNYEIERLCHGWPDRLRDIVARGGDALPN